MALKTKEDRSIRASTNGARYLAFQIVCLAGALIAFPGEICAQVIHVDAGAVEVDDADGLCSLVEAIENFRDGGQTHPDCASGGRNVTTIQLAPGAIYLIRSRLPELPIMTLEGNGATLDGAGAPPPAFPFLDWKGGYSIILNGP